MRRIWQSFRYGVAGLAHVVRCEWNMRFHLAAAAGAVCAAAFFRVSAAEWALVAIAIALVLSAECFNTAIERLADRTCREEDPLIRQCKDTAAAGVLVTAILSLIIAGLVFLPHIVHLLKT